MKLWLDDLRPPLDDSWHWVKTVAEAVTALREGKVTYASLDHDLGDASAVRCEAREDVLAYTVLGGTPRNEQTGYDLVKWMAEHDIWPSEGILIHSWNYPGAESMCKTIDRYGPYSTRTRHVPDARPTITIEK